MTHVCLANPFRFALLALLVLPLASRADVESPDCAAIQAWAAAADPKDRLRLAPNLDMPRALTDEHLLPLFGLSALEWTAEDIKAARATINDCYQAARRARDEGAKAFRAAGKLVARDLARTIQSVERARQMVEQRRQAVADLPDSPALYRGLGLLVGADSYEATDRRAFYPLPQDVAGPLKNLYAGLRNYPDDEREALYAQLAERREQIREQALATALETIEEAADDAAGLMAVRRAAFEAEAAYSGPDGSGAAEVTRAADKHAAEIEARLEAQEAAWRPPTCEDLYRWGSAPGAYDFNEFGANAFRRAFGDDYLVPVFGRSLADWTPAEMDLYRDLATLCEARWQALLPPSTRIERPGPDAPELVKLASTGRWVTHPGTTTHQLPEAQQALRSYAEARERLDTLRAELKALPAGQAGLDRMDAMARDPVLGQLSQADRLAFQQALRAARNRATANLGSEIIAGLDAIEINQPADLARLQRYREQSGLGRLDPSSRVLVEARLDKAMRDAAAAVQPAFQAALEALPVSEEGVRQAARAPAELTGLAKSNPALSEYNQAAYQRAQTILAELDQQRCHALWKRIGLDEDDAAQALWIGDDGATLGAFACLLEDNGNRVEGYEGAGLMSDVHTLKLTTRDHILQTLSLHRAEVAAGEEMLIGFELADANHTRELSVADWKRYVAGLTGGSTAGSVDCERLMNTPVERLSVNERMQGIGCLMQRGARQMELQERGRRQ